MTMDTDGFDPSKPFKTRDGRQVEEFCVQVYGGCVPDLARLGYNTHISWYGDGRNRSLVDGLDLVNVDPTTPASAESADAGESDAAFVERMARAWEPHKNTDQGGKDIWRLIGLVYLGHRFITPPSTSTAAGGTDDDWQPIKTAPKDGSHILAQTKWGMNVICWERLGIFGEYWFAPSGACGGGQRLHEGDITYWRVLPAPPDVPDQSICSSAETIRPTSPA